MSRTMIEAEVSPPSRIMPDRREHALLTVLSGPHLGAIFRLEGPRTVIGRADDARIRLPDNSLSWHHACIHDVAGKLVLEDLNSTNGTFLGRDRVRVPAPLFDGARIGLGRRTVMKLALQDALEAAVTERLYEAIITDPLTGAHNRLAFDERLRAELAFAIRNQTAVSVIMVDIDHFKHVNDTYGHLVGDAVLQQIVLTLKRAIRTEDLLARYGGEEFAVIARGITPEQAVAFAERLRQLVAYTHVDHGGDKPLHVTTSFGAATATAYTPLYDQNRLVAAADDALYSAKRSGRNRVVAWQTPPHSTA